MKRLSRIAGVTLLEIMLVLAIAAMIIVLSIRYYQATATSSRVNATVNTIQGIVAASESYLNVKGTFANITPSALDPYLPGAGTLASPFGGKITFTGMSATGFTIDLGAAIPTVPCDQVKALLPSGKIAMQADCKAIKVNAY